MSKVRLSGIPLLGFGIRASTLTQMLGVEMKGLGFRVQGFRFCFVVFVQDLGFWV